MSNRSSWPTNGDEILRRDWNNEEVTRSALCRSLGVSTETMYKAARRLELSSRRRPGRGSTKLAPRPGIHDAIGVDYEERRLSENAIFASDELLNRLHKFHSINEVVNV